MQQQVAQQFLLEQQHSVLQALLLVKCDITQRLAIQKSITVLLGVLLLVLHTQSTTFLSQAVVVAQGALVAQGVCLLLMQH
jgi:hypothetical protein